MRQSAAIVLAALGVTSLLLWMVTRIRYRITEAALEITLFGMCVRRVALTDIRWISKHRSQWCEKWPNTLFPGKRALVIERRSGKLRHLLITPLQRYVFKADLQDAVRAALAQSASREELETDPSEEKDDKET